MASYKYDLHMHSCLSPCGDEDMTPNNMVNMALLLGCQIMAITDHNSCKNAPAAIVAGQRAGLLVIPGMELCTAEEAHVVCLFESLEGAMEFDRYVWDKMPPIMNKPEIFGRQLIRDEEDRELGFEEKLLISATSISADDIVALTEKYGGAAFPAHLDKGSYSLLASLGFLPPEMGFKTIELSSACNRQQLLTQHPELEAMAVLRDSDAHYLENMGEEMDSLELASLSAAALVKCIKEGRLGRV